MKRPLFQLISILGIIAALLFSQQAMGQLTVERERSFTGAGLYGYMNGGAEQYMEYDVISLVARDILYHEERYSVEVYELPTAADAFGLYSIHVFKCDRADSLSINCLSAYQLQAAVGTKYISVVFPSGTSKARQMADEVMKIYTPACGSLESVVPKQMGIEAPYSGRVNYFRGPLSISTASSYLTQLLKERSYSGVWYVGDKTTDSFRAMVLLPDPKELELLKAEIAEENLVEVGEDYLLFSGVEPETEETNYGSFGF